jgi:3-polyprenyl-4-hydroxybenzoate decarboxylase
METLKSKTKTPDRGHRSGASGIIYGVRILEALKNSDIETHLVMSVFRQDNLSVLNWIEV